jgi:hypothetical protein
VCSVASDLFWYSSECAYVVHDVLGKLRRLTVCKLRSIAGGLLDIQAGEFRLMLRGQAAGNSRAAESLGEVPLSNLLCVVASDQFWYSPERAYVGHDGLGKIRRLIVCNLRSIAGGLLDIKAGEFRLMLRGQAAGNFRIPESLGKLPLSNLVCLLASDEFW